MTNRAGGTLGALALAAFVIPLTPRVHESPPSSAIAAVAEAPLAFFGCSKCKACIAGHKAPETASDQNGVHDWCMQIVGCSGHGLCNPADIPPFVLETLVDEVIRGDASALETLLRDYPAASQFNPGRRALQLRGCDGALTGHIPLRPIQVSVGEKVVASGLADQ